MYFCSIVSRSPPHQPLLQGNSTNRTKMRKFEPILENPLVPRTPFQAKTRSINDKLIRTAVTLHFSSDLSDSGKKLAHKRRLFIEERSSALSSSPRTGKKKLRFNETLGKTFYSTVQVWGRSPALRTCSRETDRIP